MRTGLLFPPAHEIPMSFSQHVGKRKLIMGGGIHSFLRTGIYSHSEQASEQGNNHQDVHLFDDLPLSLCSLKGRYMSPLFDEK